MYNNTHKHKALALLVLLLAVPAAQAFGFGSGAWDADPWFGGRRAPRRARYHDPYARYDAPRRRPDCAVLTSPLRLARFDVREDAARGGHTLAARLPGARTPTVSVSRPGVLEVRADRPVPPECRPYAARDELVKEFRVPRELRTSDLDARYSSRDGLLTVHVPEPGAPAHCLNAHSPLARAIRPRVEAPRGGGGGADLSAQMPRGVTARNVRVSVPEPGVLELRASRPAPRGCERHGAADDTYTGRWRVPGLVTDRDIEAASLDARGFLTVRARPARPTPVAEPRPPAKPVSEPAPPAPEQPAKPAVSLREIKRAVAELAAEYLEAEREATPADGAPKQPSPLPRAEDDIVDDDGAPRWYHTPLEGDGAEAAPCEPDAADELWIELW